jgi:hypothetical protein
MNPLFKLENTYEVNDSMENVRSKMKSLVNRRWSDFSENISGTLSDDDSFKLHPKWSFGYITGFGSPQDFTYLIGTIEEVNSRVIIKSITRPNYINIGFFYLLIFIMVGGVLKGNFQLLAIAPVCLVFAGVMIFGAKRLRNRFERMMDLKEKNDVLTV